MNNNHLKHIWIALIMLFSYAMIAQTMGPEPKWIKEEQAPVDWNGNPKPSTTNSDEWWYAHIKIYDAGVHVGYAACGYSTWSDAVVSLSDQDNCYKYLDTIGFNHISCENFETNSEIKGELFQTIARYDLNGDMVWCKRFNNDAFLNIVQDSDENLVAVGLTNSVRYYNRNTSTWDAVGYNPDSVNTSGTLFSCMSPSDMKTKASLVKVDLNGNLIWNYMYGVTNTTDPAWQTTITSGISIIEFDGGYRFVGKDDSPPSLGGLMVQIDKNGGILNKQVYTSSVAGIEFFDLKEGNGHIAVTGWQHGSPRRGFVYHFPDYDTFLTNTANMHILNVAGMSTTMQTKTVFLEFISSIQAFAIPVFYNADFGNWNGYGDCQIQFFDETFGANSQAQVPNPIYAGKYKAFDLKMGVTAVTGGFATVCTKETITPSYTTEVNSILTDRFGAGGCSHYNSMNTANIQYWDTDASVAKYSINTSNLNVTKVWETTFDPDNVAREYWPGDIKRQECLYTITADDADESIVIAGNTSNNFDDSYLVKLHPDNCVGSGDVYMKDNLADNGIGQSSGILYLSEDIWVRLERDTPTGQKGRFGSTAFLNEGMHENPHHSPTKPNYVYVRVRNESSDDFCGGDLHVYWSKASTGLNWDTTWKNYFAPGKNGVSVLHGDEIRPVVSGQPGTNFIIPPIAAGKQFIMEIPWYTVPDENDFVADIHHFCLLARIVTPNDPMTFTEGSVLWQNVSYNNNIAWRNVSIYTNPSVFNISSGNPVNVLPQLAEVADFVGVNVTNPTEEPKLTDLKILNAIVEEGNNFFDVGGAVIARMDNILYETWAEVDFANENIEYMGEYEERHYIQMQKPACINKLLLEPFANHALEMAFILKEPIDIDQQFNFDVQQFDDEGIVGGERYEVHINEEAWIQWETAEQSTHNIEELAKNYKVILYPNITSSNFTISYSLEEKLKVGITIYDVNGRIVMERLNISAEAGDNKQGFDAIKLSNGLYFAKVQIGNEVISQKLIVSR